jgi:tetratricopeptide (TPR) repeat protein
MRHPIMILVQKPTYIATGILSLALSCQFHFAHAQQPISNRIEDADYKHGVEQFDQGHYLLSLQSLEEYLKQNRVLTTDLKAPMVPDDRVSKAQYNNAHSRIKLDLQGAVTMAEDYIAHATNQIYRQRTAFALAQYYFQKNELARAIDYYELAGIESLSNSEIADAKFELAYCYFNELRFDKAKPLFAAIKELQDGRYYNAGNYYYGLLAYNDGNYDQALKSFERIHNLDQYKDIVPYYEAEIHYFKGNYDKVLAISDRYLRKKEKLYYDKELNLLTAQTLFEQKKYKEALPYFEYYYDHSDKIRKEVLYEMAFTYYRLEKWDNAVEKFQPLSNAKDSLGQISMYLLGDCYLKVGDKKGARNAFGICSDMDFNPSQKEAASFLYAKLSYELGHESIATRRLNEFITNYPQSTFNNEAKTLLTGLLAKSSNFGEAFAIISDMPVKDNYTWGIYQQVAVGRALQLMQGGNLSAADSVLSLSLQQPVLPAYEIVAYFWKSELAYRERRYPQSAQYSQTFLNKIKGYEEEVRTISKQATIQNAQLNLGYAKMETQEYEDANRAFTEAQQVKSSGYSDVMSVDATLRQADALFMQKDFAKAASLYDKAITAGVDNPDYARYQKALIFGLQSRNNEKIALLNDIIAARPASEYKIPAEYELAVTYLESDRNAEAIAILQNLSTQKTNESIRGKALLKLGYAYQEVARLEDAASAYKLFIKDYPSLSERAAAMDALRNVYITTGQPEAYDAFVRAEQLPSLNESELDNTYYAAAEALYADSKWEPAAQAFAKYLEKYPNGISATKAAYYQAESYYQLNKKDRARSIYDQVLANGWSDFAEHSAERAAGIAMEQKDYDAAANYYGQLRNAAMGNDNLLKAYTGQMKAAYGKGDLIAAARYADDVLTLSDIPANLITEAQFYKARALQNEQKYAEAKAIYDAVEKKNQGAISAEARYRIAEMLLLQRKLSEAEAAAGYAMQSASGQDYWMIKTYILMADILTEQKDYFNAKATLQSVVKNATEKELKAEANAKLDKVKELEKLSSKMVED